jgi:hypothetical protein
MQHGGREQKIYSELWFNWVEQLPIKGLDRSKFRLAAMVVAMALVAGDLRICSSSAHFKTRRLES